MNLAGSSADQKLAPTKLIARCGMNCGLCYAHLRANNPCPGCRGDDRGKPKTRVLCQIKKCRKAGRKDSCSDCASFPCDLLLRLDRRYRTKYGMSMIENLKLIRRIGLRGFVRSEVAKWACPGCGNTLCVHQAECLNCRRQWR